MQCTFNLRIFQKELGIMRKKQQHTDINCFQLSINYLLEITYCTASIERVKFCSLIFFLHFKYQTYKKNCYVRLSFMQICLVLVPLL